MEREKNEGRGKRPEEGKKFQDDPSRKGYGQQSQPQYGEPSSHEGIGGAGQDAGDLSEEERGTMSGSEQTQGRDLGSTEGRGGKRSPQSKSWNEGGSTSESSESDVSEREEKEDLP